MEIWLLEPYCTGSHQAWAEGFRRHSAHHVTVLSLPGRWWKWRMHGGAITLARMADQRIQDTGRPPDLLLATDMLDLATFLALTRRWSAGVPVALYMHENQLTYPLPADRETGSLHRQHSERDLHYPFMNYASMLAADAVFFNSRFHLDSWFQALPGLLNRFPDYRELDMISQLQDRSSVLPLGLDLRRLDTPGRTPELPAGPPLLLWNHRWEYDKDPAAFFRALGALTDEGLPFRVAVCGKNFRRAPAEFDRARQQLGDRIVVWGELDWEAYTSLLHAADIVVSTALHDFFGVAVVEAIYCGCRPVLPHRLAYAEHIPPGQWGDCLYQTDDGLLALLREAIARPELNLREAAARYDWGQLIDRYDRALADVQRLG